MKVSNETKVGILAAFAITLLILGFNFLKGRNLMAKKDTIYAVFPKVDGLSTSDAVRMSGLQIGNVSEMEEGDQDLTSVVVGFHLIRDINIPDDSYAVISANPLGATSVNIVKGKSKSFIENGDTLQTIVAAGMIDDLKQTLSPVIDNVSGTLTSVDSLVEQLGLLMDPATRQHLQTTMANLDAATRQLTELLDTKKGPLASTLQHVSSITGNLRQQNDSINRVISNAGVLTEKLAALELDKTLSKVQATLDNLNTTLNQINSGQGTAGKLVSDPKLYQNLNATANSLNILLQDLRLHPKRYINVSVFGRKDKTGPLMQPLPDSANNPRTP
ncbi:MAG: MlaD family protein [bacterium]|jgi:phospholipid/cholesterol/gamma-HCH transport system substrate-binding protein|nr:MlaD family protein [Chitinophagaceae bacterium]